jgi:hypothetical protein
LKIFVDGGPSDYDVFVSVVDGRGVEIPWQQSSAGARLDALR